MAIKVTKAAAAKKAEKPAPTAGASAAAKKKTSAKTNDTGKATKKARTPTAKKTGDYPLPYLSSVLEEHFGFDEFKDCLLYTSPSPRD